MDNNFNTIGISLGMKCDSAIWGTIAGIRQTKINGYKTCPFDEMISNLPGIIECLRDDFKYFCDPAYLCLIFSGSEYFIYNKKYRFVFNHESPGHDDLFKTQNWKEGMTHYINNNYSHFITRYNKRIASFREYLSNPKNFISFILMRYNTYQINLDELKQALTLRNPCLKFHIIILSNNNTQEIKNTLKLLQFTDEEDEVNRLNYWYG